jgi:serine/threonine-protein kinase
VREQPVPPGDVNDDVPEAFDAIVLQAMAKNPNDRYSSAEELRQDLLRFRQGRMVLANPTVAVPVAAGDATVASPVYDATQVVQRTQGGGGPGGPGGPPPKRGTGAFVLLLVVMLAVLGGLLYLFGLQIHLFGDKAATRVQMPMVVGLTADKAEADLKGLGLHVLRDTVANPAPAGQVVDQDPASGQSVDKGGTVTIKVSAPAVKVKVPALVGKKINDARQIVDGVGLNLVVKEQTDPKIPADQIISQTPAAQTEVDKGSAVEVVVSTGKTQKSVPEVTGKDAADAANELGQAGFKTKTTQEASSTVDPGKVVRTDPAGGSKAEEGSTVTIFVSSGAEQVAVPNVMGKTAADARADIEAAGLVYREAGTAPSNSADDGKVVAQNPGGGTRVDKGTTVRVTLGKAGGGSTTTAP